MPASHFFSSKRLIEDELFFTFTQLTLADALEIGEIAKSIGAVQSLPIAIEVRLGDWIIYHASLPGSTTENQGWIDRKARVVMLKNTPLFMKE